MQLVRTTLRLDPRLKKEAERKAFEANITFQELFNRALEEYLDKKARVKAKKIVFKTHNLGEALDNLTRRNYYPKP